MKFAFVTCVQLGLSCMHAIYEIGGSISLAVTLEDDQAVSKSGRVFLDEFCSKNSVPLLKCRNINDPLAVSSIMENEIDWLFIVGWSQIARETLLKAPHRGVLGMHPTLLPVGRGRAAVPWAILKNLPETGVTLFQMDGGIDTGPIIGQTSIALRPDITATELYREVDDAHVCLIKLFFPKLAADEADAAPQDDAIASEWPQRRPEDGAINMAGSVHDAERLIRAVTRPYPGAFILSGEDKLTIWQARVASVDDADSIDAYPMIQFADGTLICTDYERTQVNE